MIIADGRSAHDPNGRFLSRARTFLKTTDATWFDRSVCCGAMARMRQKSQIDYRGTVFVKVLRGDYPQAGAVGGQRLEARSPGGRRRVVKRGAEADPASAP